MLLSVTGTTLRCCSAAPPPPYCCPYPCPYCTVSECRVSQSLRCCSAAPHSLRVPDERGVSLTVRAGRACTPSTTPPAARARRMSPRGSCSCASSISQCRCSATSRRARVPPHTMVSATVVPCADDGALVSVHADKKERGGGCVQGPRPGGACGSGGGGRAGTGGPIMRSFTSLSDMRRLRHAPQAASI